MQRFSNFLQERLFDGKGAAQNRRIQPHDSWNVAL